MPTRTLKTRELFCSPDFRVRSTSKGPVGRSFRNPRESSLQSSSYSEIGALNDRMGRGSSDLSFSGPNHSWPAKALSGGFACSAVCPSPLDCVDANHHRGIELVLNHLVELGHERIGFLTTGYDLSAKWAQYRHSAFLAETARLQLPRNSDWVIDPTTASRLSVDEIHQLAAGQTRKGVTAWVCAADHQGYQLYSHLTREGFSVPGEVSITGFDGIARRNGLALTTLRIPYHEIGLTAENAFRIWSEAVRVRPSHFHRLHFATTRNHLKTMKSMPLLILCLGSATLFAGPAFSDEAWQVTRKAWDALGKKNLMRSSDWPRVGSKMG